jgi:TPR repeat protein
MMKILVSMCIIVAVLTGCLTAQVENTKHALDAAAAANSKRDFRKSMAIYDNLIEKGQPEGMVGKGMLYWVGAFGLVEHKKACDLFEQAAEMAHGPAQHLLADCFFSGKGRPNDYGQSKKWYEIAIMNGEVKASCALGNQYRYGLGVDKDLELTIQLCRFAADLGDPDAQTDLASVYLLKNTAEADKQAFDLLTKAARKNQSNAMITLATLYSRGIGVEKRDPESAVVLLHRAARLRNPNAPWPLAQHYFERAINSETNEVDFTLGVQTLYLLTLTTKFDQDPEHRADARLMALKLNEINPNMNLRLKKWLRTSKEPPPLSYDLSQPQS